MNIKRAKQEIKNAIEAYLYQEEGEYAIPSIRQRPLLLIGPPGIGKTQIMEQLARECQIALVSYTMTHHTRQSAIGLPYIARMGEEDSGEQAKQDAVTRYTMSEIIASVYDKQRETGLKEGILFLDEINCVSETLAPAMLQFLQCKTFGNHALPQGWIIVAAGNPPEYNKSVREFDIVTLDRVKKLVLEADYPVWKEYAYEAGIHPAILSYLNIRTENFYRMETTVDGKSFATPRGWEDLSRMLQVYEKLGKTADRELVEQYLQHPKTAKDFANYLELYYKYEADYRVEEILDGHIRESLFPQLQAAAFDERVSVIGLLLSGLARAFRKAAQQEAVTEELLTEWKRLQTGTAGQALASALRTAIQKKEQQGEEKLRAGHWNRESKRIWQQVLGCMQEVQAQALEAWQTADPEAQELLRQSFSKQNEQYESLQTAAERKLEAAFDFMERAFGDRQEMVLFVTELNTSGPCIRFLKEYDCERYYRYNKRLLFEDREAELKKQIAQL